MSYNIDSQERLRNPASFAFLFNMLKRIKCTNLFNNCVTFEHNIECNLYITNSTSNNLIALLIADPWTKLYAWFKRSNTLTSMAKFARPAGNPVRRP